MISPENLTSHEFVGLDTKIIESSNPQIIGLNGRIIEETKSMFRINTQKGTKFIAKANKQWEFTIQNREIVIDGSRIQKRPYDRIGGKL